MGRLSKSIILAGLVAIVGIVFFIRMAEAPTILGVSDET